MRARVQQGLREVALPFMQDLYEVTHENVHLAILDGRDRLIYVEKIAGHKSVPAAPRSGGSLPVHATASGKLLLAFSPPDVFERVVERGLRPYTPHTVISPVLLRRSLAELRERGYAIGAEEVRLGSVAVAAAVRDHTNHVVAALSVVGHSHNIDVTRVVLVVRSTARAISRQLGAPSATY